MQLGPQLGMRGFWIAVFALIVASGMWVTGLLLYPGAKESFSFWGLGTGIGAALVLVLAPEAVKKWGEWQARSKDQSTIAEQTQVSKSGPPPPQVP